MHNARWKALRVVPATPRMVQTEHRWLLQERGNQARGGGMNQEYGVVDFMSGLVFSWQLKQSYRLQYMAYGLPGTEGFAC